MEEKRMKKRIISILTFLLIVVCLTGCGNAQVTPTRIEEFTKVAQNIKDNPNYVLPDGFTFEPETETENGRIVITATSETNKKRVQKATFDMTQEEPQLEKIEESFSTYTIGQLELAFQIGLVIILGLILFFASA